MVMHQKRKTRIMAMSTVKHQTVRDHGKQSRMEELWMPGTDTSVFRCLPAYRQATARAVRDQDNGSYVQPAF